MSMSREQLRAWRASKIDRVVLTVDALDDFRRVQYGGIEIGGGCYGAIVDGAIEVCELLDLSRHATPHEVSVRFQDMLERSRPEYGRALLGHWHTHEQWDELCAQPSREDRIAWEAMARAFDRPFLALVASPTSPGSEMTGPMWGGGGNWSAWAYELVDGELRKHRMPLIRECRQAARKDSRRPVGEGAPFSRFGRPAFVVDAGDGSVCERCSRSSPPRPGRCRSKAWRGARCLTGQRKEALRPRYLGFAKFNASRGVLPVSRADPALAAALDRDAVARYERALQDAVDVREAWETQGRVLTITLPNGCETVAPLWKLVQQAEQHASRMARELRQPGRPGRKSFLDDGLHSQPPPLRLGPAAQLRRTDKAR